LIYYSHVFHQSMPHLLYTYRYFTSAFTQQLSIYLYLNPDNNPIKAMHPLVRDLYKRAILVGQNYPQGIEYVRAKWKLALRNHSEPITTEQDLHKAVAKGRYYIREMEGIIQLKKYRTMKERYGATASCELSERIGRASAGNTISTK